VSGLSIFDLVLYGLCGTVASVVRWTGYLGKGLRYAVHFHSTTLSMEVLYSEHESETILGGVT